MVRDIDVRAQGAAAAIALSLAALAGCGSDAEPPRTSQQAGATKRAALERRPPFYRLPPLELLEGPRVVSLEERYDAQPSLAASASGAVWAAWVATGRPEGDRVVAARLSGSRWSAPQDVTPDEGQVLRPVLAALGPAGSERLVCLWTATGAETGIFGSWLDVGADAATWSAPTRVSPPGAPEDPEAAGAAGHHHNPELARDPEGRLWVAWQAAAEGGFDIRLARLDIDADGALRLASPRTVSGASGAHWDPTLACGPDGAVTVVWSRFERGDYDLFAARMADGELGPPERLTGAEAYDLHPSAAADAEGRVWVVFDRMRLEDHGRSGRLARSEDGALLNVGIGTRSTVELGIACLDGERRLSPPLSPGPPRTHRIENAAYPRAAVDPSGALWVAYRAWGVKLDAPQVFWWDTVVMRASSAGWSQPEVLKGSDGDLEEPALVCTPDQVLVAASIEYRRSPQPNDPHPEDGGRSYHFDHHWNIAPLGDSGEIVVARFGAPPAGSPELSEIERSPGSSTGAGWVERLSPRRAIEVDGERFELFFGDTHRHSTVSRCTAGADATIEDHHRYARDVLRLDFVVVSDHSGQTSDFNWWTLCKAAELHHRPNEAAGLVTLFGYEISCSFPTGHKNLLFPERPARPLRLGLDNVASGPQIWGQLEAQGARAITIPHTPAMPAGTDWEDYDPRYERLVEIFQARTGSSEHAGAPRLAESAVNELGFVHRALDKGHRLGFIASTDHGHGAAYACVYARGATREDLFEALQAKRCYGSTAYGTVLDVRVNGRPMGSELTADGPIELTLEASAPTPLARAVLFDKSRELERFELDGSSARLTWSDPETPAAGEQRAYYVRLELENDELAWSSPIWVTW